MTPPFRHSPRPPFNQVYHSPTQQEQQQPSDFQRLRSRFEGVAPSSRARAARLAIMEQQQQNSGGHPPHLPPATPGTQQGDDNKITPELLVDALSGHEDGLLSIAERLMTHYDSGYDAMGEAIIDAFADVQKLFQHVVEAAHMEGAALERERTETEWRRRTEALGIENTDEILYGNAASGGDKKPDGGTPSSRDEHGRTPPRSRGGAEEHRHEELIDQDVRDVLIDAIRRGQVHRDSGRHAECRTLYEAACANASSLLPVDSDHRGRLQLAVARAESMAADRSVAILKYAMDDVLRSGLTLRQGRYSQMDVNERGDCVLSRPNPLRTTPSRGYEVSGMTSLGSSGDIGHALGIFDSVDQTGSSAHSRPVTVEQSAEEALNSLEEEMREILAAPVYDTTPLQGVSERFWLALGEARRSSARKEERLEQALARIKADSLLAREDYEAQLVAERERNLDIKRRWNEERNGYGGGIGGREFLAVPRDDGLLAGEGCAPRLGPSPKRPLSSAGSRGSHGDAANSSGSGQQGHGLIFRGMDPGSSPRGGGSRGRASGGGTSSGQSVVSLGSEFAQRAKSLVHLLNCQGDQHRRDPRSGNSGGDGSGGGAGGRSSPSYGRRSPDPQVLRRSPAL